MSERLRRGGAAVDSATVPPRALLVTVALMAAVISAAACDLLDDDQDLPSVARVEITGTAPEALELVVSDNFNRVANVDQGARYNVLVHADTSLVQPAFAREYDIGATHRFLVRLTNHALEVAEITLSVAFDGEVEYSQRATLSEGGALEFSEVFFGT